VRRTLVFSLLVVFGGLVLTVWWMHSAEEAIVTQRQIVDSRTPTSVKTVHSVIGVSKKELASPISASKKVAELDEILISKNDNDPRLDTDFKNLNEPEKTALQSKYLASKKESFNERGTIVFLLGRNISNPKDLKFIGQVLNEPPCVSLENCTKPAPKSTGEAAHMGSVNDVTMAYPQIVSLKSIETFLEHSSGDPTLAPLAIQSLKEATHSKSAVVAHLAENTLRKFNP